MSRLLLLLLLLLAWLTVHSCQGRFTCTDSEFTSHRCNCSVLDKNDYRIHCDGAWSHDLAVRPGEYVGIRCGPASFSWEQFLDGGRLRVGFFKTLTLSECEAARQADLALIGRRLGLDGFVQELKYDAIRGQLRPSHFDNMSHLQYLDLADNYLGRVDKDLLRGVPDLKFIGLRSTGIELPAGFFRHAKSLRTIELSFNGIKRLEPGTFDGLEHIFQINMWMNELRELEPQLFRGLKSLKVLDLNHNLLQTLPADVFADLKNLQLLNLSWNNFSSLPEGLFRENLELHTFKLSHNRRKLQSLPEALLAGFPSLSVVQMKNIGLRSLAENLLWNSKQLKELELGMNFLDDLPSRFLRDATSLRKLDLSYNDLTSIPNNFFLRAGALVVLDLSLNRLTSINETTFEGLKSLKELNMEKNKLSFLHHEAFFDLEELKVAKFSNNRLTMYTGFVDMFGHVSPLRYSPGLQELHLANNNVSELFADWIYTCTQLRKLDLSNNSIAQLRAEDLQFISNELEVNLRSNKIRTIDLTRLEYITNETSQSSKSVQVLLQGNPLECDCEIFDLLRYLSGDMMPKARWYVKLELKGQECSGPEHLQGVELGQLEPSEFLCKRKKSWLEAVRGDPCDPAAGACDCWFRPLENVLLMNCTAGQLTRAPERIDASGASSVVLDLSDNLLTEPPNMRARGYEKVNYLLLARNRISAVNESLVTPSLKYLGLDGNNLTQLDSGFLEKIGNDVYLTAEDNPWRCDCEASPLLSFVQSHIKSIPELLSVRCANGTTALVELSRAELCPFPYQLVQWLSIGFGLVCLLFGVLAILYMNLSTPIKIWLYAHNLCLCFVTEDEVDKHKSYDAFISYSHKDEAFVKSELVARLEAEPCPYKLCIHERDWLAGAWIPTLISHSVEESRRTVIVLSRNFLESDWSKLEFQTAHKQSLEEHRMRLIVVVLDDIQIAEVEAIDPELASYLRMNVYVKWSDPYFWQKLYYAMPHRGKFAKQAIDRVHERIKRIQKIRKVETV